MADENNESSTNFIKFLILLFMLVVIAVFIMFSLQNHGELVEQNDPTPRATKILNAANLANLPESAKNVHVYAYQVLFIARVYVSFEAEPNDIEKFIADSPALEKLTCHTFSKEMIRQAIIKYERIFEQKLSEPFSEQDYILNHSNTNNDNQPEEEIEGAGRYYDLSVPEADRYGELIIDDEKHIIYMYRGN